MSIPISKLWTAKYGYHLGRRVGRLRRDWYERRLRRPPAVRPAARPAAVNWSVALFVGRASLPDACRALTSFTAHVGQPASLLLASDGTLTDADVPAVRHWCDLRCPVRFTAVDVAPMGLTLSPATASHPMIRKLAVLADLIGTHAGPTLYVDSDVVFFPPARDLGTLLADRPGPAYMLDETPMFDDRLIRHPAESASPVNSGLLWLPRPLDWARARRRLADLGPDFAPTHFTEQTAVHLAMHDTAADPLDPRRFVMTRADQFEWRDRFAGADGVICRHYVGPVRHKMWLLPLA